MTTVLYHRGALFFDSRATERATGIFRDDADKGFEHGSGEVFSGAGRSEDICAFLEAYWGGRVEHSLLTAESLVIRCSTRELFLYSCEGTERIDLYTAVMIGSGAPYASEALLAGLNAAQAISYASRYDPATGGAIHSLRPEGFARGIFQGWRSDPR